MLFAFMREHKEEFSIEAMCRVFGVSSSGYYAHWARSESERARQDREITEQIETVFLAHKRRYGSHRVRQALHKAGRRISRKRVARLMRQRGLRASAAPRSVRTTDSRHSEPIAPNRLARDFTATAPNQKWAGDITYVWTSEGWLYLAVFLDLFSRAVIGWSMSDSLDGELARSALRMALNDRQPGGPLIVHSDRGVQYAAREFRRLLDDWSITPSMSRKGNCYDNAASESFFATLKKELVHRTSFATRAEARTAIFEYIVCYYNRERMHSTLGYATPEEFEKTWLKEQVSTVESATVGNASPQEGFSTGVDASAGCEITAAVSTKLCPL